MYKKEFDSLSKLPNYLVFYGNEFYLQKYEKDILEKFKNANILKMYYDEFDLEKAKIHLNEASLFGGENVLIIKNNKIPPNLEKLTKNLKDAYLFFFYYGNKPPKTKNFVRFFEPDVKELIKFIDEKANNLGINITKEAKMYLINSLEAVFLEKELEKLALYSKNITLNDVKELVFLYKQDSFEDVIVSILKGEEFENKLKNLLEKVDFKRFLSSITRYVKDLYKYNLYIKKTGTPSLKGLLGYQLPFDIEKQRIELAVKFKEKDYYILLKNLLEFELKMRKGNNIPEAIFYEAIAYLKTFNSF